MEYEAATILTCSEWFSAACRDVLERASRARDRSEELRQRSQALMARRRETLPKR